MSKNTRVPISEDHLAVSLIQLSILKFFPMDEFQHRAMMEFLRRLCGHSEGLSWLVSQLVDQVGEWPGPAQIRAIYCTRYKPADGIESAVPCTISGFTADDTQARGQRDPVAIEKSDAVRLLSGIEAGEPVAIERWAGKRSNRTRHHVESELIMWREWQLQIEFGKVFKEFRLVDVQKRIGELEAELAGLRAPA